MNVRVRKRTEVIDFFYDTHTHTPTPTQKRHMKVENKGMIKGMLGKWDGIINSWQNRIQGLNN